MTTRIIIAATRKNRIAPSLAIAAIIATFTLTLTNFGPDPAPAYPVLLGYCWLVFSPLLIDTGHRTLTWFLGYLRPIVGDEGTDDMTRRTFKLFFHSKHLIFSVALAPVFGFFAFKYAAQAGYSDSMTALITTSFSLAGFMAGIGFWGIVVMGWVIADLCRRPLHLDPFSADGYGGLLYVGRFLVVGAALFFSGSLFIPFANVIFDMFAADRQVLLAYACVAFYILFGLSIYMASILRVHDKILDEKVRIDDESQLVLDKLRDDCVQAENDDLTTILKPYVYYKVHHERIAGMRTFPYDTKSLIEITATVMIPLLIFILERLTR
ncbi:hypothetical protein [Salidesulfovibrio brasiliensis]